MTQQEQQIPENLKDPELTEDQEQIKDNIISALQTIYDPEIPVDIYSLGLIYKVLLNDNGQVVVVMTLTSPHCPVAEEIPAWVQETVSTVPGVSIVEVELTFDPPWDMDKMSDEAKLVLGVN